MRAVGRMSRGEGMRHEEGMWTGERKRNGGGTRKAGRSVE